MLSWRVCVFLCVLLGADVPRDVRGMYEEQSGVDVDGALWPPSVSRNAAFGLWILVLACDVAL